MTGRHRAGAHAAPRRARAPAALLPAAVPALLPAAVPALLLILLLTVPVTLLVTLLPAPRPLGSPAEGDGPRRAPAPGRVAPIPPATAQAPVADSGRPPTSRLAIPSLHVDAPIDTAHAVAGSLVLPADASRVARYDASPPLGARTGTTIVAGHVTNLRQVGALFPLATARTGAIVHTTDDGGRPQTWRVVSVSAPLKADLPASIFTASGPRRLAIITCGGTATTGRDGSRSYPRNVVVIAVPSDTVGWIG